MFADFPKIFGRDFTIGYFFPAFGFIVANLGLLYFYEIELDFLSPIGSLDLLEILALFGLGSWIGGTMLLVYNRELIRILEGYGRFNPIRLLIYLERHRYKRLIDSIDELEEKLAETKLDLNTFSNETKVVRHTANNTDKTSKEQEELANKLQQIRVKRGSQILKRAKRFPDSDWLLPTAFGNVIRATEVYPRLMYGIEGVDGWYRLLSVIPIEYRDLIDSAKAKVDFWINSWILSLLFYIENLTLILLHQPEDAASFSVPHLVLLGFGFGGALISPMRAESMAVQWGDFIRASFDVYLPDLYQRLGLPSAPDWKTQQINWSNFSQAILYRNATKLPTDPPDSSPNNETLASSHLISTLVSIFTILLGFIWRKTK